MKIKELCKDVKAYHLLSISTLLNYWKSNILFFIELARRIVIKRHKQDMNRIDASSIV